MMMGYCTTTILCTTIILQLFYISTAMVHQFKTNQEYLDFRRQNEPQGIFYYHHPGIKEFTSRTKILIESADGRMPAFMKLGMVNCMDSGIKSEDIDGCTGGRRKFFAYRPNGVSERFSLRTLHNEESFISQMIYFAYQEEISLIVDMSDWGRTQNEFKGKKDLLFMYFKGTGGQDHYAYMMLFLQEREKQNFEFTFSTDEELAVQLGKNMSLPTALWFLKCSAVAADSEDPCPVEMVSDTVPMEVQTMNSFIHLQSLPLMSKIQADGSSIFHGIDYVHTLFFFFENDEQETQVMEMAKNVIGKCKSFSGIQVRVVTADRRMHAKMIEKVFGITMETMLPTAMLKPYLRTDVDREDEVKEFESIEPFTPDEDFVSDALFSFIENLVTNREKYIKSIADIYHITCIKSNEWKGSSDIKRNALIGICSRADANKEDCITFKRDFRRIVRTMYSSGLLNFEYIYIDELPEQQTDDFNAIPALALILQGKVTKLEVKSDFEKMLQWINGLMKMNLPVLPISGSDLLHLPPHTRHDENAELPTHEEDEDLILLQEDEVGLDVSRKRTEAFYEDDVTLLTDETFGKTVNMTEFLLVFFYYPRSDDYSFAAEPIVAAVNEIIMKDGTAKVAKINCEEQFLACRSIHTFPRIQFYSKGDLIGVYKGLLDVQSILKALRLYQKPSLQKLSEDSIPKFKESSMGILGWFAAENEEFQVYKKVADMYHGKMSFAYATGEATRNLILGMPQSNFVAAYVQGEASRILNGGNTPFTEMDLHEFLKMASIPKFGELTMSNFPAYKSLNKPLLIVFLPNTIKPESIGSQIISPLEDHVIFTWMNMDNSVTKDIRRSYLGTHKYRHADIVIVNHTKGEVYHYTEPQDNINVIGNGLSEWILKCVDGQIKAKSYLKVVNWKPLREGFDFLSLIDNNQIRAGLSVDEYNNENEEKEDDMHTKPSGRIRSRLPVEKPGMDAGIQSHGNDDMKSDKNPYVGEELDENELADLDGGDDNLDGLDVDMSTRRTDNMDEESEQLIHKLAKNTDDRISRDEL